MDKLDVSLVLAVYNEEECLAQELAIVKDAMAHSGMSYEIIVIDDCSTDKSRQILQSTDGITLFLHDKNMGAGSTRSEGVRLAKGEIVVWTDMDLTYPNALIPDLVRQLKEGGFRQVIGRRIHKDPMPPLRETVKFILRAFASFMCGCWIKDLNSGFRAAYREDVLKIIHLIPQGFSCCTTMTMSFIYRGFKVGYMDIVYRTRAGTSKFHPIYDTYKCFRQVLRVAAHRKDHG